MRLGPEDRREKTVTSETDILNSGLVKTKKQEDKAGWSSKTITTPGYLNLTLTGASELSSRSESQNYSILKWEFTLEVHY